ncbi:MAG: isoleucine--tRNA ligase [Bacteroidota bacterium]
MHRYPTYKSLELPAVAKAISTFWQQRGSFKKSLARRRNAQQVHFYEGPPGANGRPGIHHVFSRTLKDLFCRYKTMQGFLVARKAGFDTHGLPVELGVEKALGITKEDIGNKISIAAYNAECKKAVMRYQKEWEEMTAEVGFWLDMSAPYLTYEANYISVLWGVLSALYQKGYLYKGYSIQPYSPAAGTGLSNHELNQPGCYKEVKDTSLVAQFASQDMPNTYFLAWTTTPWTLPANSALAVNPKITYVRIATFHPYLGQPIEVILAEAAIERYFDMTLQEAPMENPMRDQGPYPWTIKEKMLGAALVGKRYDQLLPYVQPEGDKAFQVFGGDFVTTTEGTGIVHIAPTFGADDYRLAQQYGIPSIMVAGAEGQPVPIVDEKGRFVQEITDFAGAYVKPAYDPSEMAGKEKPLDVQLAIKLKRENKAFYIARYMHSYPHCWRTDKPILYYPMEAWFIKTTACRAILVKLNKTIRWQPAATGSGRFGNFIGDIVDWNITRDRYWGTPLPIWRTEDQQEEKCIDSLATLRQEVDKAVAAGFMTSPLAENFDPHRPYVDDIVLVSAQGKKMYRDKWVVDVWFDSGAMPYAQHGEVRYAPAELSKKLPADFIIEGVDQTRGWFFTLHVLAGMLGEQVAFKNVLSTGLVLDKHGQKMSKRLGNTVDPIDIFRTHGPDVLRWYMVVNAPPWENLKFDMAMLEEIKRRFFGTLFNTYQFFALYANLDGFKADESVLTLSLASQSDRWILSKLQGLIEKVTAAYDDFSPMQAARAIQYFAIDDLSNWYVRLNRKRFWQGGYTPDKVVAYRTLHYCLCTIAQLAAPIAPFYMDQLYQDLQGQEKEGVHLSDWPKVESAYIDRDLEKAMKYAQTISSLVHSLRKQHRIKVRQPLVKILIPISDEVEKKYINQVADLILAEVNVKEIAFVTDTEEMLHKEVKPNFQRLGKVYGPKLKQIGAALGALTNEEIRAIGQTGECRLHLPEGEIVLSSADVLITTKDIPGWAVAREEHVTIALDLTRTPALIAEGLARELVNRIQNLRKQLGFAVEDKISLTLATQAPALATAFQDHQAYIMEEVQAKVCHWSEVPALRPAATLFTIEGEEVHVVVTHYAQGH